MASREVASDARDLKQRIRDVRQALTACCTCSPITSTALCSGSNRPNNRSELLRSQEDRPLASPIDRDATSSRTMELTPVDCCTPSAVSFCRRQRPQQSGRSRLDAQPRAVPYSPGICAASVRGLSITSTASGACPRAGFETETAAVVLLHGFPTCISWRKVMLPIAAAGAVTHRPARYGRTAMGGDYDGDLASFGLSITSRHGGLG